MASIPVPPLRYVSPENLAASHDLPTPKIRTDADVETWKHTNGYADYSLFLRWLSEAVVGCSLPWTNDSQSEGIRGVLGLLDELDRWIDEVPPLPTAQRFGNLAFRTWGKRLEDRADELLSAMMSNLSVAVPHVRPYFLTAFGSFLRMDYGTGHETSFAIFLLCLTLVRFLRFDPDEARDMVLGVFVRYLRLCWRLQDVYRLEPAGSHGVWGLDDSHFLGYIFGSAQLRDQSGIPVSAILHPPLPLTNLYFLSIMRIHEVKHGPFHEHSSQLYSIATGVATWRKVNSGLFKMYEAEVLGKRVVVQHLPLGGVLEWNDISAPPTRSVIVSASNIHGAAPTPWASGTGVTSAGSNDALMTAGPRGYPSASIGASIETGCAHEFSAWPDPQMLGYRLGAPFRHLSNLWEQHRDEIRVVCPSDRPNKAVLMRRALVAPPKKNASISFQQIGKKLCVMSKTCGGWQEGGKGAEAESEVGERR